MHSVTLPKHARGGGASPSARSTIPLVHSELCAPNVWVAEEEVEGVQAPGPLESRGAGSSAAPVVSWLRR